MYTINSFKAVKSIDGKMWHFGYFEEHKNIIIRLWQKITKTKKLIVAENSKFHSKEYLESLFDEAVIEFNNRFFL